MTCLLPPDRIYSADSSNSSTVAEEVPRFSRMGLRRAAERFQQGEVLHIARAHLQHVHIGQHIQLGEIGDLRNDGQARIPARLHQQSPRPLTQTLEGIGRGAGLEGAVRRA